MHEYIISGNDSGQRLDKFISKAERGIPPSLMYRLIRQKKIKVNGRRSEISYRLAEGDRVTVWMHDSLPEIDTVSEWINIKPHIDIVYEDENYIICDKRPGMLCHTDSSGDTDTLIGNIKSYLHIRGEYDPESENSFSPSLCNRIDRNTGGIVILAKNAVALREIDEAIRENRVHKKYLCAVHGKLEGEKTLTAYHRKDEKRNTALIYDAEVPGSRKIITAYKALAYDREDDLTLLDIDLITGRTHQIRAHMAHIGHPLLGDGKYSNNLQDRKKGYKYQALWSYSVGFEMAGTGLSYLDGKSFYVSGKEIGFLSVFGNFDYKVHIAGQKKRSKR